MQIVRIYSGNDGESHREDLNVDQLAALIEKPGEGPITVHDDHTAPRRQYVTLLSGEVELETADASKRHLVRGDVIVAEDETGHGHIFRGVGGRA